jgi:diguanylate cyclase (GGDEF)-like protein
MHMDTADLQSSLLVVGQSRTCPSVVVTRRRLYPILGLLLAVAAPMGLAAIERVFDVGGSKFGTWLLGELATNARIYLYLLVFGLLVFVSVGAFVGARLDRMESFAITDGGTGLFNRGHFKTRIEQECQRSRRHQLPLSLMLVDIDHLKRINDTSGHEGGDAAISAVAAAIKDTVRSSDVGARYGGDEFAIILPHTTASQAVEIAHRLQDSLLAYRDARAPTISVGVADLELADDQTPRGLLLAADRALYAAKAGGRCAIRVAQRESPQSVSAHANVIPLTARRSHSKLAASLS